MPKLPRNWRRGSVNILNTRDANLFLVLDILPGQTVERVHLSYRIMGRDSESTLLDNFDAYYVGLSVRSQIGVVPAQAAWTERDSDVWMWWEGAYFVPVQGSGTPGQTHVRYPLDGAVRDIRAKRLNRTMDNQAVVFSFARSGGSALTDQRVNANASVLVLG